MPSSRTRQRRKKALLSLAAVAAAAATTAVSVVSAAAAASASASFQVALPLRISCGVARIDPSGVHFSSNVVDGGECVGVSVGGSAASTTIANPTVLRPRRRRSRAASAAFGAIGNPVAADVFLSARLNVAANPVNRRNGSTTTKTWVLRAIGGERYRLENDVECYEGEGEEDIALERIADLKGQRAGGGQGGGEDWDWDWDWDWGRVWDRDWDRSSSRRSFLRASALVGAGGAASAAATSSAVPPEKTPPFRAAASDSSSLFLSASSATATSPSSSSYELSGIDSSNPPPFSTRREYRDVTLSNGLRVLLVRDTGAVRSSAALSVGGAGQFADPDELPGLAHLMEHTVLSSRRGGVAVGIGVDTGGIGEMARKGWAALRKSVNKLGRNDGDGDGDGEDFEGGGKGDENAFDKEFDFEDWIADRDGASNGFTAPGKVCFHFACPPESFPEALERFASLFRPDSIREACANEASHRKEVRRIDSELNRESDVTRAFYLLKGRADESHPFSRTGMGSIDTLERAPAREGIDVGEALRTFFEKHYLPERAVLVVVGPDTVRTLERMVAPFAETLSDVKAEEMEPESDGRVDAPPPRTATTTTTKRRYPDPFPPTWAATFSQTVLIRNEEEAPLFAQQQPENGVVGTLALEWPLSLDYGDGMGGGGTIIITAPAVGFVISQILGRRGPGSLYQLLNKRGWVPRGSRGVPRISIPVDASGFQIMRMDVALTERGYDDRSAVIAAVYNSVNAVRAVSVPGREPFALPRELLNQYLTIARLHGYVLAPRPPDAVELAADAQIFGLEGPRGVGSPGSWPLVPSTDDTAGVERMRGVVASTLAVMSDPAKTIATVTASRKAIFQPRGKGIVDPSLPPLSSPLWKVEPVTGARYFVESRINLERFLEPLVWVIEKLDRDELGPPVLNPLVPATLRPPRPVLVRGGRLYYLESGKGGYGSDGVGGSRGGGVWREYLTQSLGDGSAAAAAYNSDKNGEGWKGRALASLVGNEWKLWQAVPGSDEIGSSLPLPLISPEPSCRCSFVVQLLSERPLMVDVRKAARAQLWLNSFDDDIIDLAELGAPAGLAYDAGFNKYGLRICFRGVSQTLPSYVRRFCRRLVQHHSRLEDGSALILPSTVKVAISQVNRFSSMSPLRRRQIVGNLRAAKAPDVVAEGLAFIRSFEGGVALAQGDILPNEAVKLVSELRTIFDNVSYRKGSDVSSDRIRPNLQDILYKPFWKPRTSSPALIPGVSLIADACGRVPR